MARRNYAQRSKGGYRRTRRTGRSRRMRFGRVTGRVLRKSILGSTNQRVLEVSSPVFWLSTADPITNTLPLVYAAVPSFGTDPNTTNADILLAAVRSPEFISMARTWSLFRIKGIKIKYINTMTSISSLGTTDIGPGAISLNIQNSRTVSGLAAWYSDNALRIQSFNTSPKGVSKYYKSPMRSISVLQNKLGVNDWLPTNATALGGGNVNITEQLFLNIGSPLGGTLPSADNPNGWVSTNNGRFLVGKVLVYVYTEFSQPISTTI